MLVIGVDIVGRRRDSLMSMSAGDILIFSEERMTDGKWWYAG